MCLRSVNKLLSMHTFDGNSLRESINNTLIMYNVRKLYNRNKVNILFLKYYLIGVPSSEINCAFNIILAITFSQTGSTTCIFILNTYPKTELKSKKCRMTEVMFKLLQNHESKLLIC